MCAVDASQTLGDQLLDGKPHQVLARVPEHLLGLMIRQPDHPVVVDEDHSVRGGLEDRRGERGARQVRRVVARLMREHARR